MTPRLVGITGTLRGTNEEIGDRVTLGSAPESTLRIASPTVSKIHARVVKVEGQYYVEDAGSRNGTYLNGQRVKRFPIRHLDVLTLAPGVDLIFMESGTPRVETVQRPAIRATIAWLDGPLKGRVDELPRGRYDVGRSAAMPNPGISQKHASLVLTATELFLEDLGSTNGTFVNGRRIAAPAPLKNGDRVSLGQVVDFQVSILAVRESTMPAAAGAGSQTIAIDEGGRGTDSGLPELNVEIPGVAASELQPPLVPEPPAARVPDRVEPKQEPSPSVAEPPPAGATVLVTREPLKVPTPLATPPPVLPGRGAPARQASDTPAPPMTTSSEPSAHPATIMPPREAAGGVPRSLAQRAREAREVVDATIAPAVPKEPAPPDAAPPAASERVESPGAGIEAARFEGPQTFTLPCGTFIVGRQPDCPVFLDSRDVGRRHAQLIISETGVSVEDLNSSNGTFVNDARVSGIAVVNDGGSVRFATVKFTVTYMRTEGSDR